jgi:type II protein arginine methyltransferase
MMAARAGAARVVGCEINPAVYDAAKEVLELNALADRVTLVNKDCRQLTVPDDLPARADLVLFELFDCSLLGEGVLHFLAHAREHLAAADARYIPMGGKIRAMLVEHRLDSALGDVDINLLNPYRFSRSFINVDAGSITYRPLTEPFDVFSFNFATATVAKEHKEICTTALVDGIGGAVLFWFELQIDQETWVSNSPDCPHTMHWKQALQFLPEVHVENGMPIPLDARHDGSSVAFRWREAELPHRAFSRLPRFDPHAWQQAAELESQTQQLLQHCSSDPDEFARVAQLAIAFALDPAAQGLDPTIAERFASMFFAG